MMDLAGLKVSPEEKELLAHPLIGGVILFTRNYESPQQIAGLIKQIHDARQPPILVAVDHEGGRIQRFHKGFTMLPSAAKLGETYEDDPASALDITEICGWVMAAELRAVGVDFSFAPVLDLERNVSKVIGDRAFHKNPEIVANLAHAYMKGMQHAGMEATGKHFPGHGGVKADSHHEIPQDYRTYEDIYMEDIVPFERMVRYGMAAIMTAHVIYPNIDNKLASFSPFWIEEVLRNRINFQGAVFSDDLVMQGASVAGSVPERARAALNAGCDMVLVCNKPDAVADVLDELGDYNMPTSQIRLARMHGRHPISMDHLHKTTKWRSAVKQIEKFSDPGTLELDV